MRNYQQKTSNFSRCFPVLGAAVLGGWQPVSAVAQESTAGALEEVVVTARRREERLQDVPISMTLFDQEKLDAANITNAGDLATYTPSLQVNNRFGPDTTTFSIRGFSQELRTTASVGVYFAEVVAPRGANSQQSGDGAGPGDLFDLQNVQVLKGPQGTLFGRNTTGGAVLITPQKPTDEFEGYLEVSSGNYDMWRGQGVLNIPVSDSVRLRFGVDQQERDGYLNNISGIGPDDFADINYTALRASMSIDITDSLENYTIFKWVDSDNNGMPSSLLYCNPDASFGSLCAADLEQRRAAGEDGFYDTYNFVPGATSEQELWQGINITSWQINDSLLLKNILSYAELETGMANSIFGVNWEIPTGGGVLPFVFSQLGMKDGRAITDQKTWVEEIQLQGEAFNARLEWQAGLYYEKSEPINDYGPQSPSIIACDQATITAQDSADFRCNNLFGVGAMTDLPGGVEYTNQAVYAQGTYHLSDQWRLTAGLRYTDDKTEGRVTEDIYYFPTDFVTGAYGAPIDSYHETRAPSSDSAEPTWLLGLDYVPTQDLMVYAKYARGYRQGSVNLSGTVGLDTHDPEQVDTYELGLKSTFDGVIAGNFNLAVFYNDFADQQIQYGYFKPSGVGTTAVINAGASTISGLEIESTLLLTDNLSLNLGYSYLDTEVDDLVIPELPPGVPVQVANLNTTTAEGEPLSYSPENKLVLTANYRLPLSAEVGSMTASATYVYTDDMQAVSRSTSPYAVMPSYDLLNLNFNWRGIFGSPLDLSVFATNVTDEEYVTYLSGLWRNGLETGQVGQPRMYGMRLRYNFGAR